MPAKTKSNSKPETEEFEIESPEFPIKYLHDLAQSAIQTALMHLDNAGVPDDILQLVHAAHGLRDALDFIQEHGGKSSPANNDFIAEFVTECIRYIPKLGGDVFTPLGNRIEGEETVSAPEPKANAQNSNHTPQGLEESAYPVEVLDIMSETAYYSLYNYLRVTGVRKEAWHLLDILYCIFTNWISVIERDGKVPPEVNGMLKEYISEASRDIAALGGVGELYTASEVENV